MKVSPNYIGVDVSMDWIDVYDPRAHRSSVIAMTGRDLKRFANSKAGDCGLGTCSSCLVLEPIANELRVDPGRFYAATKPAHERLGCKTEH